MQRDSLPGLPFSPQPSTRWSHPTTTSRLVLLYSRDLQLTLPQSDTLQVVCLYSGPCLYSCQRTPNVCTVDQARISTMRLIPSRCIQLARTHVLSWQRPQTQLPDFPMTWLSSSTHCNPTSRKSDQRAEIVCARQPAIPSSHEIHMKYTSYTTPIYAKHALSATVHQLATCNTVQPFSYMWQCNLQRYKHND